MRIAIIVSEKGYFYTVKDAKAVLQGRYQVKNEYSRADGEERMYSMLLLYLKLKFDGPLGNVRYFQLKSCQAHQFKRVQRATICPILQF